MPFRRTLVLIVFVVPSLFAQKSNPPAATATTTVAKTPPAMMVASCDPKKFITRAYQDVLGRPIEPAGEASWLGQMKNGMSRNQVAAQLLRSGEHSNARIQNLYNTFLHRPAGGSDLAYFSGMLQQGTPIEQVKSSILGSPEYFNSRGGGTNAGFIAAMYQDVLGRAADPQGINIFGQQLTGGSTRIAVAQQVVTSQEASARWMSMLYNKYLHHAAPGGAPGGGQDQVAASIISSDEYCRQ